LNTQTISARDATHPGAQNLNLTKPPTQMRTASEAVPFDHPGPPSASFDQVGARAPRSRNQLAASAVCRTSLTKSLAWQLARRSRKSPLHARALAPTMLALPFPGTSGPAESRSVTGSSTPRSRPERSNTPRSDSIEKRGRHRTHVGDGGDQNKPVHSHIALCVLERRSP
jgi:hypothetical protein